MIVGEMAWHKDFWGVANTALTKSVSLNFPESSMFVKVALVRFEDEQRFAQNAPWVSIGIMKVQVVNKFPQIFPVKKGLTSSGTAASEFDQNVYVFFDNRMVEAVVGGTAENATGTFTWVLETWG
jgi:hypothetical protein